MGFMAKSTYMSYMARLRSQQMCKEMRNWQGRQVIGAFLMS